MSTEVDEELTLGADHIVAHRTTITGSTIVNCIASGSYQVVRGHGHTARGGSGEGEGGFIGMNLGGLFDEDDY